MKFIKEYVVFENNDKRIIVRENVYFTDEYKISRIIVRTNTYGSNMKFFNMLANEVKKDFPFIDEERMEIHHYSGERYKRTYGIEFNVSADCELPKEYRRIDSVERTL